MGVLKIVVYKTLLLHIFKCLRADAQCLNATEVAVKQLGLNDKPYWKVKVHDFEHCAKVCVRRKPCLSITYDSQTRLCEMHTGTKADTPTRNGMYLMYSEFQWWPSSMDVSCYSRPCQDSEVCIPGSVAAGSPDCSYTCMKTVRDVCPMPVFSVSSGRTVGSVNVYTCGKGLIGGGSATCLPNKTWDNEIDTTCRPIYLHSCTDDTLCSEIKATCSGDGKCDCVGASMSYDEVLKECVLDCQDPPQVTNAGASGDKNTQTYVCNGGFYPTAGSVSTVTCSDNGWEPANKFSCYTCQGAPPNVAGATLSVDGRVRKYTCAEGLYKVPGTGDGNITCTESSNWEPQGFLCGGLRLNNGSNPDIPTRQYSGYLEMFFEGTWKAVTYESWTWQATKVACKTLFGFSYGGTYHTKWFDTINQNRLSDATKLDKLSCTGEEEALELCTYDVKDADINKQVALTCFDYDFTTPEFEHVIINNASGQSKGILLVKIDGEFGAVCGSDWSDKRTKVACRSLKTTWTRQGECTNSCEGAWSGKIHTNHVKCNEQVPHIFYCDNSGWGYNSDCDDSKLVGITCNTGSGD